MAVVWQREEVKDLDIYMHTPIHICVYKALCWEAVFVLNINREQIQAYTDSHLCL